METLANKLDIEAIRSRFPVLEQKVNGKPLIYFDNAASSQTVDTVVNCLREFYQKDHANIHRGIHTLAERSTQKFEKTRESVHHFINSKEVEEVIFTKGTTESINLVAQSWGSTYLKEGDEIILSQLEHHSNIVPWQITANRTGAVIKIIPVNEKGELILEEYQKLLSEKTRLVAINHISNSLGTINPVKEIIKLAKEYNATTLIDGAQAMPHLKIDVQDLDCDFFAFSSHKMFGPTGVGVLYGKRSILEAIPPYQGGGEMIKEVSFSGTIYNHIPHKFEAGTPNIGGVIALKEAIDFIEETEYKYIQEYENALLDYAFEKLVSIDAFRPIGIAKNKASVMSFLIAGIHPYDLGQFLDTKGIAVRTGHHCTQPLMEFFQIEGTVRASFSIYNTMEEVDTFVQELKDIIKKFS